MSRSERIRLRFAAVLALAAMSWHCSGGRGHGTQGGAGAGGASSSGEAGASGAGEAGLEAEAGGATAGAGGRSGEGVDAGTTAGVGGGPAGETSSGAASNEGGQGGEGGQAGAAGEVEQPSVGGTLSAGGISGATGVAGGVHATGAGGGGAATNGGTNGGGGASSAGASGAPASGTTAGTGAAGTSGVAGSTTTGGTGGTSVGGGASGAQTGGTNGGGGAAAGTSGDPCADVTCSGHGTCAPPDGGCACDAGYEQPAGDTKACIDIDECANNHGGCDPLTTCSNFPGGFSCGACPTGYMGSGASGCTDIDECANNRGGCDPLTTCTNSPGGFSCGACPTGYQGIGETGCTPIGCSGAPDPGCACLKVALDGDDAAATTSGGALPFRDVQTAIDFADAQPKAARAVCVATGSFAGPVELDLSMRNGVSVYGGYDESTWERTPGTLTTLLPGTALGVVFGADVSIATTLDGFSIDRFDAGTTSAVTVDGAVAASLVNVAIAASPDSSPGYPNGPDHSYGVSVLDGGHATIVASTLALEGSGGVIGGSSETMAVRVIGASAVVGGGGSLANTIHVDGWGELYGVWLEDSPGSQVIGNSIEAQGDNDLDLPQPLVVGVGVQGDAGSSSIQGNQITATNGYLGAAGIDLIDCADTAPTVADNSVSGAATLSDQAYVTGWLAIGIASGYGCQTLIQNNHVDAKSTFIADAEGIECGAGAAVLDNAVSTSSDLSTRLGTSNSNVGVVCDGCAEVSRNQITGLGQVAASLDHSFSSVGLFVSGDATLVDSNRITGGLSSGLLRSLGVSAGGTLRIQNNIIEAGGGYGWTGGVNVSGAVDLDSNYIDGGTTVALGGCTSAGITVGSGGAIIRNNIITPGTCATGANLQELFAGSHPSVIENNDLVLSPLGTVLYKYQGGSDPKSADDVNALTALTASGNFTAACALPLTSGSRCIDAGTPSGAPSHDIDDNPRNPASPDVGPYEWGDLAGGDPCGGVTCSGHGSCERVGIEPECACDMGYTQDGDDALTCVEIDECAANNGGCDSRVTCTNTPGGRVCGDCPAGYVGNGDTGCSADACSGFSCSEGASCTPSGSGPVCDCPSGTLGPTCGETFTTLSAENNRTCGVLSGGALECWGFGALGDGFPPSGTFLSVATSSTQVCGLQTDGTVACWGSPALTAPNGTLLSISGGLGHFCGILSSGSVACWGDDTNGQASPPEGEFKTVVAGRSGTCGIRSDDTLACWGSSSFTSPPTGTYTALAVSWFSACAVRSSDGSVACWGSNGSGGAPSPPSGTFTALASNGDTGMCGLGTNGSVSCWGGLPSPSGSFEALAVGSSHACGLRPDGSVTCWGGTDGDGEMTPPRGGFVDLACDYGVCGVRATGGFECWPTSSANPVPPADPLKSLAFGYSSGCGLLPDNTVECWGSGSAAIPPSGAFQSAVSGTSHSCALDFAGKVTCWGSNAQGQASPPNDAFTAIAAGGDHTCGLHADGSVVCWGSNTLGESDSPTGTFSAISSGAYHNCGLLKDGAIGCWGTLAPAPPTGTFVSISSGSGASCARRSDGSWVCFGRDDYGQSDAPSGSFDKVVACNYFSCGLRDDHSIECWGLYLH